MINMTNKVYREKNLAIIQKVPTPITLMKLDKSKGVITLAYFDQKSTIDYIGAAQGIPICFDAKETHQGRLPLQNVHQHQVEFMEDFQKQGGISFLLVNCKDADECYFLPLKVLKEYWTNAQMVEESLFLYTALRKNTEYITKTDFLYII